MSNLVCRGLIAHVALAAALLWSTPAVAQVGYDPGPPREPGGLWNNLMTGVHYDVVNQAKAEHHLHHVQAKLMRDAERGHSSAVDHDLRRIHNLRYRIVVDEWLIRKNMGDNPGYYPYPLRMDPISCAAIAQYRRPPLVP